MARRAAEELAEPKPTVREAMRMSELADARLLAGENGLDRSIEWVRLMETPEIQPRAGDLLLTTGFPIKDDLAAQIRLIGRIAESGGAGLMVKPHPYLRKLAPEMLTEANRLDVPLFTVPASVQLVDVMAQLLERIINAEHSRLKRSIEIHRRFTELVLDGKGVNEICKTLSDLLESAVVIEDASFHLLAHAGGTGDPHRKETIQRQGTPQRVLFDPQIQRMLREIEAKRGPIKVPALPHVGMSKERLRRVTAVVRASYPRALVQGRSDSVVALLPLGTEPGDHQSRVQALGMQVKQSIADWKPGFTVSVGFSGPVDAPTGVAGAQREVTSVMDSLARFKRWGQVVAVPELGLTGLLAAVADERLVDYAKRLLGPLVEHDRARNGSLVATLRAFLETGEQQEAAKRLRVHPNTLRYRLDRIREIGGFDLEEAETRLNLAVALRVQALLGM